MVNDFKLFLTVSAQLYFGKSQESEIKISKF